MSGKFKREPKTGPAEPAERPDFATAAMPKRTLAKYDRLGQTMVATIVVPSLSGPDAAELAEDITARMFTFNKDEGGQAGVRHVVLDFSSVQYIDSMCIGVLVDLLGKLKTSGGHIALVNTEHNLECLFKLTKLDRVFPMCRDVMKAIEAVEREG